MIRWSEAKLDEVRQRSVNPSLNPVEMRLAAAELLAAIGRSDEAERLIIAELAEFRTRQSHPEWLTFPFLRSLIIVRRLDLAAEILAERHQLNCHVELEFNEPGSGEARLFIDFLLPERLKITIDGSILTNDKTDVEVLWLDWIFPVFAHYSRNWPGDRGRVMFSNWDDAIGAGLAMCSNRPDCFLIPDNIFVPTRGYAHDKVDTKQLEKPWDERKSIAFWRGSTTGQPADPKIGWRSLPRLRLCEIARDHPAAIDAGISKVIQIGDPKAAAVIQDAGLTRPYVPAREFNDYKYQIDIDGNTNAWPGLFQKLLSGNPVLKVASPRGYRQWYYDRLKPWIHFVPVAADMSDLIDKIKWLQQHDDVARGIGEQGQALALLMDVRSELDRSTKTISAALRFFSGRPEIEIEFNANTSCSGYLRDGWAGFADGGGAVMAGHESALELDHPIAQDDFILSLDMSRTRARSAGPPQRIAIIANGVMIHQGEVGDRGTITVCLPYTTINAAERLGIRMLHPDAKGAASQDFPLDTRTLSLVLHRLTLTAVAAQSTTSRHSSYLTAARPTNLIALDGPPPALADLRQVVTYHGTLLYVDPELGEVRHGPGATVPRNLYAVATDGTVFLYHVTRDGTWHALRLNQRGAPGAESLAAPKGLLRQQGFAVVKTATVEAVGLGSVGLLLCAEDGGRITLSRSRLGDWETFRFDQAFPN